MNSAAKDIRVLPLLRWAGSKKRQFSALSRVFPRKYNRYVEPFAGSASFAFCLGETRLCLNDLNADLVSFYKNVRVDPSSFYRSFSEIPRDVSTYYKIRASYNESSDSIEKSILFYYLNRNCFNGIFRLNRRGEFNVPFSDYRVSPYLTEAQFLKSAEMLAESRLTSSDFEEFCYSNVIEGDFVFLDPPYYSEERIFGEYTARGFTQDDFARLERVLEVLHRRGVCFLLSYPSSALARKVAARWKSVAVPVLRTVAGDAGKRRVVKELLIYNYDRRSA